MITIKKTKAGFHVVITGNNNEVLCTSEVLKTKSTAFKNVLATAKNFKNVGTTQFFFIDEKRKVRTKYCWQLVDNKKILLSEKDI